MSAQTSPTRDASLDILRGIGLFCILLAHVYPPTILFQLRNFDVPLMVLVAGSSFCLSSGRQVGYGKYLYDRFLRLVIPTWLFLAFFFLTLRLWFVFSPMPYPYSSHQIFMYFALLEDFVWVIRVFFLVAILAPWIYRANQAIRNAKTSYLLLLLVYVGYEFAFAGSRSLNCPDLLFVLDNYLLNAIPYGTVFALGMMTFGFSQRQYFLLSLVFLTVFAGILAWHYQLTGSLLQTQGYKFPPRLFYLLYALGMAFLLYGLLRFSALRHNRIASLLAYLGQRTLWVYLWHIYVLFWLRRLELNWHFSLKLVVLMSVSIGLAYLQEKLVSRWSARIGNPNTRKTVLKLLTG